jgi:hypothetical protein
VGRRVLPMSSSNSSRWGLGRTTPSRRGGPPAGIGARGSRAGSGRGSSGAGSTDEGGVAGAGSGPPADGGGGLVGSGGLGSVEPSVIGGVETGGSGRVGPSVTGGAIGAGAASLLGGAPEGGATLPGAGGLTGGVEYSCTMGGVLTGGTGAAWLRASAPGWSELLGGAEYSWASAAWFWGGGVGAVGGAGSGGAGIAGKAAWWATDGPGTGHATAGGEGWAPVGRWGKSSKSRGVSGEDGDWVGRAKSSQCSVGVGAGGLGSIVASWVATYAASLGRFSGVVASSLATRVDRATGTSFLCVAGTGSPRILSTRSPGCSPRRPGWGERPVRA